MPRSIEHSIKAAGVSLRMEGLSVTAACKELFRKLLAGEMTLESTWLMLLPAKESTDTAYSMDFTTDGCYPGTTCPIRRCMLKRYCTAK